MTLPSWRERAKRLKTETYALFLAYKDPRVPWYARLLVAGIVAYAFSPIDLIPDFIPVLGYLDDLVLIPLGIALALQMIPPAVMEEARTAAQADHDKPVSRAAIVAIVLVWLLSFLLAARIIFVWIR